ncbi:hypothetical protein EPUL_000739 [Erysiphe pulchra]|uniref:Uncharacterized protein n=1 Tax=Erysiphe pulchra TaxID=225359 RepID=A0A2S4Q232_9PEZI|nr:hypothetical protein EPUL_000739 [Erysiphe pulchra]
MSDTDLRLEVRELRQRTDDWPSPTCLMDGPFPRVKIEKDPEKKNYKLKPQKFPIYKVDRVTYGAWRRSLWAILKNDWNTFKYQDSYVFVSIYNAFEGKAQREAAAFFESGGLDGKQNPDDFIVFLDRSNWDQNKVDCARAELTDTKMDGWLEDVKISLLKGEINYTLKLALANNNLLPSNNYYKWFRIVGQIAQQHDELSRESNNYQYLDTREVTGGQKLMRKTLENNDNSNLGTVWSVSKKERGLVGDINSNDDTFMGGSKFSGSLAGIQRNASSSEMEVTRSNQKVERRRTL